MARLSCSLPSAGTPAGLLAALREQAPAWFPGSGPLRGVRLERTRRLAYSTVHVAELVFAGERHRVVVKVFPGAAVQFLALRAVWPRFARQETWRVPKPLAVLEPGPALVMTAVQGRALQTCLPRWSLGAPRAAALAACRRAGAWLRFYHDATRAEHATLDVTGRLAGAEEALAALADHGVDGRWSRALRHGLAELAIRLTGRALATAHVHGEFTVDNVLVDRDRVAVLDVWGRDVGAVHHDLASFLNSLWLLRLTRPALRPAAVDALGRAFLEGYGLEGRGTGDRTALAFLQLVGLLDAAVEIAGRRRRALERAWLARVLQTAAAAAWGVPQ